MRIFVSFSLFIISCVCIAIAVSFGYDSSLYSSSEDDEQEGLSEQIVINFSHVVAENTPKGLAAQKFASLVHDKTGGKVKVEVFANGILYSDKEEIDALIRGDVELIAPAFSKLTDLSDEWQLLDLPYLFKNDEDVKKAFEGKAGEILLKSLESHQIKGLALWSNGFKQMTSNAGPLRDPSDFEGQKFRIMPSNVLREQFEMLGVKPSSVPFNKVYNHLYTSQLDGQENTISNIYSKRFYQVQDYLTISNHGYLGYAVLMNEDAWNRLTPDLQEQLQAAMNETTEWMFKQSIEINDQQLTHIREHSDIKIYELTAQERQRWRTYFEPLYRKFEPIIGEELVEELGEVQRAQ